MNSETKLFAGIILATLVFVGGAIFFLSKPEGPPKQTSETLLLGDNPPMTSTASGAVKLVEFGDYQCPACGAYHPMLVQVLEQFGDQVNFIFREFPLPQHTNAMITSQAAVAAGLQGKYWDMHNKLYDTQAEWAESTDMETVLTGYAKDIGLDVEQFIKDLESSAVKDTVNAGLADGNAVGINSTPTFFLNGYKLQNPGSYEELAAKVEAALTTMPEKPATTSAENTP